MLIKKIVGEDQFKDMACLSDINMLVTLEGKERGLEDFNVLLDKSGFKLIRKIDTTTIFTILEAETA